MNKKTTIIELFAHSSQWLITGAPKIRAMEIIHELEQRPRDIYCGTIGWMAPMEALSSMWLSNFIDAKWKSSIECWWRSCF